MRTDFMLCSGPVTGLQIFFLFDDVYENYPRGAIASKCISGALKHLGFSDEDLNVMEALYLSYGVSHKDHVVGVFDEGILNLSSDVNKSALEHVEPFCIKPYRERPNILSGVG